MTDSQFESSLQWISLLLMTDNKHPFYALFMAELNHAFDDKLPTACVGKHPNTAAISLIIGKHFWEKTCYNDSRKKAIIIHELEHVIREHLSDRSSEHFQDKIIANMAMDVSINQCIIEELPRLDENGEKCGIYYEDFTTLNLKPNESSYYYYAEFMMAQEEKKASRGRGEDSMAPGKDGKPVPGNGKGTCGDGEMDKWLDAKNEGRLGDWHGLWEELTRGMGEKEKELFRKEIQEQIKRAVEEASQMKGDIPSHIANAVKENFGRTPPVISWRTLFNRFIGSALTTDIYQTRKRPNFRFEDAPSNKYKSKIRIIVGCDSSGSVSDYDLQEFMGQIKHMHKAGVKIDLCMWDAECEDPSEYKGESTYKRTKSGGTRASCFTEYVNKNRGKYHWTCAIGLTDGYVENEVVDTKIPMLWVITKTGSTEFKSRAKKIKIN